MLSGLVSGVVFHPSSCVTAFEVLEAEPRELGVVPRASKAPGGISGLSSCLILGINSFRSKFGLTQKWVNPCDLI